MFEKQISSQLKEDVIPDGKQSIVARADTPFYGDQLSYLWSAHSSLGELIRNCDFKASLVAGWATAIIGGLFALDVHQIAIGSSKALLASGCISWLLRGIAVLSLSLNAGAFLMAVWTIVPRFGGPKWATRGPGCLDWGAVLSLPDSDRFIQYSLRLTPEDCLRDLAGHIYVIAKIADAKFQFVTYATYTSTVAAIFSALIVLFI